MAGPNPILLLSRRNLSSHKLRFALTTFSVLLGVSFVVASFVLTDGLRATFNAIVDDANEGLDLQVQAASDFEEVQFTYRPIDESIVEIVAAVDGVAEAQPGLQSAKIVPLTSEGEAIETGGAPYLAFNDEPSDNLATLQLVEGRQPTGPGEFALDITSAEDNGFEIGRTYQVVGAEGQEPFELVGTHRFGEENALAGAVLMTFTLDELQRLDGSEGLLQWISVAAEDGVDVEALQVQIDSLLPAGVEVVTNADVVDDAKDAFGPILDIFGNILLAFALVAVFVSTFIITNTFNILLGQRVRELALLRALGASGRQVRISSLLEALLIGLVASLLGLLGGIALAYGLRAAMDALGFSLPSIELTIAPRTVLAALAVGVGVTLAASLSPARRAATVPPIAGLRAGFRFGSGEGTRRTIIAIVLAVIGVGAIAAALFGVLEGGLLWMSLGVGAVATFVAISMFAPLFSSPSASFLGFPLEHLPGRQITGHMARENAARNNKRTASTAAGLMIGLALIAMATVVATSLKESFRSEMGSTLTADVLVTEPNDGTFTPQLVERVAALPEFDVVSAVRYGNVRIAGDETGVTATDLTLLTELLAVDVVSGDPVASADAGSILLSEDRAADLGLSVGDNVAVEFAAGGVSFFDVGAIYRNEFLVGGQLIDLSAWDAFFDDANDAVVVGRAASGVDEAAASAAMQPLAEGFPQLKFETRSEFTERIEGQLDSLLVIINVFLGLAIIIALLGITNTMALSVLERTQEIGLMRAIGMTRRQTRGMIRFEAGVVSLFGALLGVVVGVVFGWVAVLAIPESIIDRLAVPVPTLIVYTIIATVAGLLAASLPARRASRLNVLEAISHL